MTDLVRGYRAPVVVELTGVTYRQLCYWDGCGLVGPSLRPARGSGSQRLYAEPDIDLVADMKALVDVGLTPRTALLAVTHDGWINDTVRVAWTRPDWRARPTTFVAEAIGLRAQAS